MFFIPAGLQKAAHLTVATRLSKLFALLNLELINGLSDGQFDSKC